VDRTFGGVKGREPRARTQSRGRADIDDDTPASLPERWDSRLTGEKHALYVDRKNPVVFGLADLQQRFVDVRRSGIIHQDVEGTECGEGLIDHPIDIGFLADVAS
jgi:hypothetical protein